MMPYDAPPPTAEDLDNLLDEAAAGSLRTDTGMPQSVLDVLERVARKRRVDDSDAAEAQRLLDEYLSADPSRPVSLAELLGVSGSDPEDEAEVLADLADADSRVEPSL